MTATPSLRGRRNATPSPVTGPLSRPIVVALLLTVIPASVESQVGVDVLGRVFDVSTGSGVQNAIVTLEDHGSALSGVDGVFTFSDVAPREYTLRVEAFGYVTAAQSVVVDGALTVQVALDPDPVRIDSISVDLSTLDFDGRVRDPRTESNVLDARVITSQGHEERSNLFGRFDLDDVYEHVPLRMVIEAFGYVPLDTTLVPDDEERHAFELMPDPVMDRMIEHETRRLEDRAGAHYYRHGAVVERDDLARVTDNWSLQLILERNYPAHLLRRVGCFFIDERLIRARQERTMVLQGTMANELQRIEVLEFPGPSRRIMVRVYTRGFFQRLVGSHRPLATPEMVSGGICR